MSDERMHEATQALCNALILSPENRIEIDERWIEKYQALAKAALDKGGVEGREVFLESMGVVQMMGLMSGIDEVLVKQLLDIIDDVITQEHLAKWQEAITQNNSAKLDHVYARLTQLSGESSHAEPVPEPAEKIPFSRPSDTQKM